MLSSQLAGQPFHRILEPATTCSVFARPSFAQHLLCHSPHPTILPSPLSVYYLLYPAQAGRASVAPDLGILFAWQSTPPRASKEGPSALHCIDTACNAAHCKEGRRRGIRAMQNAVFYCGVELSAWHCKEGREGGGRGGDLHSTLLCHAMHLVALKGRPRLAWLQLRRGATGGACQPATGGEKVELSTGAQHGKKAMHIGMPALTLES